MAVQPEPLTDEQTMLCIRAIHGTADGDAHLGKPLAVPAGARLPRKDPTVKAWADHFVLVVPEGLDRSTAVLALTDRYDYRRNEDDLFIEEDDPVLRQRYGELRRFLIHYAGTWISRSDPDVAANPQRYQLLS